MHFFQRLHWGQSIWNPGNEQDVGNVRTPSSWFKVVRRPFVFVETVDQVRSCVAGRESKSFRRPDFCSFRHRQQRKYWLQGILILWHYLNDRSNNFRSSCLPQLWRKPEAQRTSWDGLSGSMTRMDLVWKTNLFICYTKSINQKHCNIFRNYWFRGDDRNHHKSLLTWRADTGGWFQQFWFFWQVWSWRVSQKMYS